MTGYGWLTSSCSLEVGDSGIEAIPVESSTGSSLAKERSMASPFMDIRDMDSSAVWCNGEDESWGGEIRAQCY